MALLSRDNATDRWLSWGLGLTALHAVGQGFFRGYATSIEGVTILCLNAVVGLLFLRRHRGELTVGWGEAAVCLGSVILSGVAIKLAPPLGQWPLAPSILFATSGAIAIVALVSLGRSFAVLPSVRGLVSRGPFRIVRHPIYAAELCMVAAAAWTAGLRGVLLLCVVVPLLVWRIQIEERALAITPDYGAYCARVRWKLVVGIW